MVKPDSLEAATLLAKSLAGRNLRWGFRGVASASWQLVPSIERLSAGHGTFNNSLFYREKSILREFKRRAHHYIPNAPELNENLEWLALLQHHGGPTRLLDFTWSFYVALYFAIRDAKNSHQNQKEAAIWAVDMAMLRKRISEKEGEPTEPAIRETIWKQHHEIAERSLESMTGNKPMVVIVEPFRMNERLSIQQGFFLCPCDHRLNFMTNLLSTFFGEGEVANLSQKLLAMDAETFSMRSPTVRSDVPPRGTSIIKIVVPPYHHVDAMSELRRMNITDATLFPGLDGFARSLALRLWPSEPWLDE